VAFFSLLACFWPVVLVALVAPCIYMLWVALVPPSRMPRDAACGRCGYPVAGLSTHECPECGTDWRTAGVSTPSLIMRYRGGAASAIVAWTILCSAGGLVLLSTVGVMFIAPRVQAAVATPQTWTTPLYPNSKAFPSVDVASSGPMGAAKGKTTVTLSLNLADGSAWKMAVDRSTTSAIVTPPGGSPTQRSTYGPGSAAAFYTAAGLTGPTAAAESAELQRVVDILLMSPYTQPSQMSLTSFSAGSPTFSGASSFTRVSPEDTAALLVALSAGGACVLVYAAGVWFIVRRRRRLLGRRAGAPAPAPR
jgi:hypothetical protein